MNERDKFYAGLYEVEEIARGFGLDSFETHFKLIPAKIMYELGAYGLPGRFSHWTFGKNYYQMKTMYDFGRSKIYELVINGDPSLAYCMQENSLIENLTVAGHVLGHTDFFKNNMYFNPSDRNMVQTASVHGIRMEEYKREFGEERVEEWQDHALSIHANFDINPNRFDRPNEAGYLRLARQDALGKMNKKPSGGTKYDDLLSLGETVEPEKPAEDPKIQLPFEQEYDLLWFIAEFSPRGLTDWEKDILLMVRNEQQYFLAQMHTKLMNEGWAAYWHRKIMNEMRERDKISEKDWWDFSIMDAGVVAVQRGGLNPYLIGSKMFEDIFRKYEGRPHPNGSIEKDWMGRVIDPKDCAGDPRYDIFEVREANCDYTFVRDYLTDYLIEDLDLFPYELQGDLWVITEKDPNVIRQRWLDNLINFGNPVIYIEPGKADYNNNRELYLTHVPLEGRELHLARTTKEMEHVYAMWGKPVHIETLLENHKTLLSFDGKTHSSKAI